MDWRQKLRAILHDPPYKICDIKGHEEKAEELFKLLIAEDLKDDFVNLADKIASAYSRIVLRPNLPDNERREFEDKSRVDMSKAIFIDIFSGKKKDVEYPDPEAVRSLFKKLGNLNFNDQDDRAKLIFLFLWRFYPDIFPKINSHPADSRTPTHSIYDHLVQTSAIVSALPRPAFLIFTINPVQSFISKARKTSDLWAGSYMLSYLIWESMKPIVSEYGPDVIVYPNLLKQPLVDRWLYYDVSFKDKFSAFSDEGWYKSFVDNSHLEERITIANMPNRFLAIVPYDKNLANKCEDAFKEKLRWLSSEVSKILEKYSNKSDLQKDIENHLLSYFKAYWAMMPWSKNDILPGSDQDLNDVMNDYEKIIGRNELYEVIEKIISYLYYAKANVGNVYPLILELAEKLLGARKSLRDFSQLEQLGEKCHLCGEFETLRVDWEEVRKDEGKGILREGEKLCGVCATKRFFVKIFASEFCLGEEYLKFPSTSELSSIEEKIRLSKETKQKFRDKITNLKVPYSVSVPKLKLKDDLLHDKDDLLHDVDGQFMMKETYRLDYLEKELGLKLSESEIKDIVEFLEKEGINPSKYYAIIQMDGDRMGDWLSGEFNPSIKDTIHPDTLDALMKYFKDEDLKDLEEILSSKHPVSPSIHQAFSRKLSIFALEKVKKIVEEEHYGKLVYAGGDDILAFVPVGKALKCAYELQKKFKEILSDKATMSAGILIVHHKYPLYLALKKVNEAEKKAKSYYCRDAFCLTFMTHGGEERECGGKWDLVDFIDRLITSFHKDEISGVFPYQYLKVVEELYEYKGKEKQCEEEQNEGTESRDTQSKDAECKIREILKSELIRIFMRKEGKVDEEFLEKVILPKFDEVDIKSFANMLVIARRISTEIRVT